MNGMTITAAAVSIVTVLYGAFLLSGGTDAAGPAELASEEAICREIAADTLNGSETLAAYMQTRCPARYLTEGVTFPVSASEESPQDVTPDAVTDSGATDTQDP